MEKDHVLIHGRLWGRQTTKSHRSWKIRRWSEIRTSSNLACHTVVPVRDGVYFEALSIHNKYDI
jgi:hypothetical protein